MRQDMRPYSSSLQECKCCPIEWLIVTTEVLIWISQVLICTMYSVSTGICDIICLLPDHLLYRSILPNNHSGHFKKATSTALQLAIANASGFVATFSYTTGEIPRFNSYAPAEAELRTLDQAPRFIRGHSICTSWPNSESSHRASK